METVSPAAQDSRLEEGLEQGHQARSKIEEDWKKNKSPRKLSHLSGLILSLSIRED